MLRNFCEPDLRHREIDLTSLWFQQDRATARAARGSLNIPPEIFPIVPLPMAVMFDGLHIHPCAYPLWGYIAQK